MICLNNYCARQCCHELHSVRAQFTSSRRWDNNFWPHFLWRFLLNETSHTSPSFKQTREHSVEHWQYSRDSESTLVEPKIEAEEGLFN